MVCMHDYDLLVAGRDGRGERREGGGLYSDRGGRGSAGRGRAEGERGAGGRDRERRLENGTADEAAPPAAVCSPLPSRSVT
jgi:hypothetical protein